MTQFHHLRHLTPLRRLRAMALLFAVLCATFAWGQNVTFGQARNIAADFFAAHGIATADAVPQKSPAKATATNSPYYIFNSPDATAFVVVSGDTRTQQILAYSTDGPFDADNIAPGAKFFLDMYEEHITALPEMTQDAQPLKARRVEGNVTEVCLETALWNQSRDFWWSACPSIVGENTHAGCVATAMAILMRHHEWPQTSGWGTKSWTPSAAIGQMTANFGETNYNIPNLPTGNQTSSAWTPALQNNVATLLRDCGIAVNMAYGTEGSGAVTERAPIALYRYFGYTLGH